MSEQTDPQQAANQAQAEADASRVVVAWHDFLRLVSNLRYHVNAGGVVEPAQAEEVHSAAVALADAHGVPPLADPAPAPQAEAAGPEPESPEPVEEPQGTTEPPQ